MFVVQSLKEALTDINDNQRKQKETSENVLKELFELFKSVTARLKAFNRADANQGLCAELLAEDIPMLIINHSILKTYDTAIEATSLIVALLDFRINDQHLAKYYFSSNYHVILEKILNEVETSSMAFCTLEILAACVNHEEMAIPMLNLEMIRRLAQLIVKEPDFDTACATERILSNLLSTHKALAAEFILQNMETFFDIYTDLIDSSYEYLYVISRASTKLLWIILYDPAFKLVMLKFVADEPQKYAAWTIKRLDRAGRSLKMELWQVIKLFVAYPAKSPALKKLLIRRRKKLIKHARQIIREKDRDDPEADEENFYVIKSLEELTED